MHIRQNRGYGRENQEDCAVALSRQLFLYGHSVDFHMMVVADGCGGTAAGERASSIACRDIPERVLGSLVADCTSGDLYRTQYRLFRAIHSGFQAANRSILLDIKAAPQREGMATTAVCLAILGTTAYVAWRGDSRCYLFRSGLLEQLTTDHTRLQSLIDAGVITEEEGKRHPARNYLSMALGNDEHGTPETTCCTVEPRDLFLLSSDGFHEGLTPEELAAFIGGHLSGDAPGDDLKGLAERMEQASLRVYGSDNLTVGLAYICPERDDR
jgi:serine/threonine protein phosphatase PrpC